ncbi:ATP-binding protein [Planctomycetota bacterium]
MATFPAVLVTGPRQSGKTTLVREVLNETHAYLPLDELDIRSFAIQDPRGFLDQCSGPTIIDEIQNAPELLSYVKTRIDQDRSPGQWVLTGSQQFPLMQNVSESLAGRIAVMTLYPFALEEMTGQMYGQYTEAGQFIEHLMKARKDTEPAFSVGSWLLGGGYPELFVNKRISRKLWFSSYVQTYIDRDVRGNIRNANLMEFERFIRLLASRTAQELNYSTLSRDVGVAVPTIKSWISLLQASSIIYLLSPYHTNYGKRIIKAPKCYFLDTGLVCYLVGLQDQDHLVNGPMAGALFETACVIQCLKRFTAMGDACSLYYWRSTDGHEVDLLIETGTGVYPIEFKLSSTISAGHAQSLRKWLTLSGSTIDHGLVVSCSTQSRAVTREVSNCHFLCL